MTENERRLAQENEQLRAALARVKRETHEREMSRLKAETEAADRETERYKKLLRERDRQKAPDTEGGYRHDAHAGNIVSAEQRQEYAENIRSAW